jgi:hypothetical protein
MIRSFSSLYQAVVYILPPYTSHCYIITDCINQDIDSLHIDDMMVKTIDQLLVQLLISWSWSTNQIRSYWPDLLFPTGFHCLLEWATEQQAIILILSIRTWQRSFSLSWNQSKESIHFSSVIWLSVVNLLLVIMRNANYQLLDWLNYLDHSDSRYWDGGHSRKEGPDP